MFKKLQTLREERARGEHGFTLIELLVVVVIIGILIAIAIPLYLNYQKGAKDKTAASDTRNAIAVVEQCYADNNAYPGTMAQTAAGAPLKFTVAPTCTGTANVSPGNKMTYTLTGTTYSIATVAGAPGSLTYTYTSVDGQTKSTP